MKHGLLIFWTFSSDPYTEEADILLLVLNVLCLR